MAGRDVLESLRERVVEKDPEFHLAVAPDIRIRRDAGAVAFDQILDDPVAVGIDQIDHPELDAQRFRHRAGVLDVLLPRAIAGNPLVVDPVLHVARRHLVALLHQQRRRHRAVHSAREPYQHLRHGGSLEHPGGDVQSGSRGRG